MRKSTTVLLLFAVIILLQACAPRAAEAPTPVPALDTAAPASATALPAAADTPVPAIMPTATPTTAAASPVPDETAPANAWKQYANDAFGLSFQYPPDWFGPDEYISGPSLRVAVGSDVVYPYGTGMEQQIYTVKDAYYVTVQYTKNDQNTYWQEAYQSLVNLQDGESVSDQRGMMIKVRQLNKGRFQGIEYIATLSETAQTEPVYIRQVILFDDQSNVLSVMGSPNNVEGGAGWREAYQRVDEANRAVFQQLVDSIVVE